MSTATVVAKGKLSQFRNVNYLAVGSFEVLAARKPAKEAKPKDDAPQKEKAVASPVADLVKDGVAARYERKDLPAAERAWRQALPLLDRPGVTPLERYQVCAGLGLLHAERKEYAQAKDLFLRAVAASREVPDNRKPLSYSHYNLACAEALLGQHEAALGSMRAALEAERQTERRRYVQMAGGDSSFAALKDDLRFQALLKEFAVPPDGPAGGAKPKP
jgi:tetratricopeptide (TPR) repeat protein